MSYLYKYEKMLLYKIKKKGKKSYEKQYKDSQEAVHRTYMCDFTFPSVPDILSDLH